VSGDPAIRVRARFPLIGSGFSRMEDVSGEREALHVPAPHSFMLLRSQSLAWVELIVSGSVVARSGVRVIRRRVAPGNSFAASWSALVSLFLTIGSSRVAQT